MRPKTGDEPGAATPNESGDDRRVTGLLLVYAGTLFVVQFLAADGLRVTAGSLWRRAPSPSPAD